MRDTDGDVESMSAGRGSRGHGDLTQLALEPPCLGDLVAANEGSVACVQSGGGGMGDGRRVSEGRSRRSSGKSGRKATRKAKRISRLRLV